MPVSRPPRGTLAPEPQRVPAPAPPSLGDEGRQPSCSSTERADGGQELPAPEGRLDPAPTSTSAAQEPPKKPAGTSRHETDPVLIGSKLLNILFNCEKYLEDISGEDLGKLSENKEFFQISVTDFLLTIYTKKRPGLLWPRKKCIEVLGEIETPQEVTYNMPVPPQQGHLVNGTSMMELAGVSTAELFNARFSPARERRGSGGSTSNVSAQAEKAASATEDTTYQPDLRGAAGSNYKQKHKEKRKRSLTSTSSPPTTSGASEDENSGPPQKRHHSFLMLSRAISREAWVSSS